MSTLTASGAIKNQRIAELESENAKLKHIIGQQKYLDEYFERYGYNTKDVMHLLAAVSETDNVWLATHLHLKQCIDAENKNVCLPGLSNDDLRNNVGRVAALNDFQFSLRNLYATANKALKAA